MCGCSCPVGRRSGPESQIHSWCSMSLTPHKRHSLDHRQQCLQRLYLCLLCKTLVLVLHSLLMQDPSMSCNWSGTVSNFLLSCRSFGRSRNPPYTWCMSRKRMRCSRYKKQSKTGSCCFGLHRTILEHHILEPSSFQ